jgi:hypothetical protein
MSLGLAVFLKSFIAIGLLAIARPLGKFLLANLPDGRIKRLLAFRW